jgi:HEPN domain-containing protein
VNLLDRAYALLASAERLGNEGGVAGAAGLAFQALDLAAKALTAAIDGADAGSHRARMARVRELTQAQQSDLDFLWEIRQRDFYGDSSLGAPRDMPTEDQVREALALARSLVERIDHVLRERPRN